MAKGDAGGKRGKRQKKQQEDDGEAGMAAAPDALPERLQEHHRYVTCGADMNLHANTVTSAHAYMSLDIDNSWSFDHFARNFEVTLNSSSGDDMEFDVKGVDPAIMNSIRRILISEVPTVAIEHVFFLNNTSIVADEMLAHRLGLVPLNINPRLLDYRKGDTVATERNTVVFRLHVDCKVVGGTRDANTKRVIGGTVENDRVLAQHLEYLPNGSEIPEESNCQFSQNQQVVLGVSDAFAAVEPEILLVKMRPGQSVELEAHCTKGIGAEHAKWSPVATAWYRLNPEVVLLKDVTGDRADELAELCAPSEEDLRGEGFQPLFRVDGSGASRKLAVVHTRGNERHLEKLRKLSGEPEWEEYLQVRKDKEHFIFTIQSTGALPPDVLFEQAIDVLSEKCDKLLENLL